MDIYKVTVTFTQPLLGTASLNPDLYREYLAENSPNPDEEVATLPGVDEQLEKATTGFHRNGDGQPFIYDYQIKGFFKDANAMLARVDGTNSKALKAYKKVIDGLVFVGPRRLYLKLPEGQELSILERPLRAQTAQGERIALARSEMAPEGTQIEFQVNILGQVTHSHLLEWLDYGSMRGLGQWRNASYGAFTYHCEKQ